MQFAFLAILGMTFKHNFDEAQLTFRTLFVWKNLKNKNYHAPITTKGWALGWGFKLERAIFFCGQGIFLYVKVHWYQVWNILCWIYIIGFEFKIVIEKKKKITVIKPQLKALGKSQISRMISFIRIIHCKKQNKRTW